MAKLDNFAKTSVAEPGKLGNLGDPWDLWGWNPMESDAKVSTSDLTIKHVDFTPVHEDITGIIWYNYIIH